MWGRGKDSACGKVTKCLVGKETGALLMKKGARAQQYMGHASKRHNIGGERMENQKGDSNVCGV